MPAAHTRISFPPPFHQPEGNAPSSGVIVSSKLRRSSAFGKFIFIVEGRSSSVRSALVGSGSQPCCVGQVVSCGVARPELSSQQTPAHGRRATKLLLSNRASLSSERPPCRRVARKHRARAGYESAWLAYLSEHGSGLRSSWASSSLRRPRSSSSTRSVGAREESVWRTNAGRRTGRRTLIIVAVSSVAVAVRASLRVL